MKKIKRSVIILIVISLIIYIAQAGREKKEAAKNDNGIALPASNYILANVSADLDKDNREENIYIYGKKTGENAVIATDINIAVVWGSTGFVQRSAIDMLEGCQPSVYIYDFTGDKKCDILVSTVNGDDKSINNRIVDFSTSIPTIIFNENDNVGIKVNMNFAQNYVVEATLINGQKFSINLERIKDTLIENKIYDYDGIYISEIKPVIIPYDSLQPVDVDSDGVYELKGMQKIIVSGTDIVLCNVTSYIKYRAGKWINNKIEYSYFVKET